MIQRSKGRLLLWGLLTGLTICFIWGNSLMPGEDSSQVSGWFSQFVGKLFPFLGPDNPNGTFLLRKFAHFGEFCILGGLLCWGNAMLQSRRLPVFFAALGAGVLVAAVDETIQRFVPGRYGCIQDVALDSSGVLTGVVIGLLAIIFLQKYRKGAVL